MSPTFSTSLRPTSHNNNNALHDLNNNLHIQYSMSCNERKPSMCHSRNFFDKSICLFLHREYLPACVRLCSFSPPVQFFVYPLSLQYLSPSKICAVGILLPPGHSNPPDRHADTAVKKNRIRKEKKKDFLFNNVDGSWLCDYFFEQHQAIWNVLVCGIQQMVLLVCLWLHRLHRCESVIDIRIF